MLSTTNLRRLAGGIQRYSFPRRSYEYWLVDAYRPVSELIQLIKQWRPDGMITDWHGRDTEKLIRLRIPTVVTPADVCLPGVGSVDVDDIEVGRMAARHLFDTGLRQFAFLGNDTDYSRQRHTGFRAFLHEAGLDCFSRNNEPSMRRQSIEYWSDSTTGLQKWVRDLPKPIGIFAVHDPVGRCVAAACREENISIPEEVAILGVDNDELICDLTHPPLSSVSVPWEKIGYEAARVMDQLLSTGRAPRRPVVVAPEPVMARLSSDLLAVGSPRLQEALRVIRERACEGLRIKDLLRMVPLSRRTLEKEFATYLRRSPREEIIRVRMNRARLLLSRTDLSMAQVAERSGFENAERFSITFRHAEGCPPSRYRQRFQIRSAPVRND